MNELPSTPFRALLAGWQTLRHFTQLLFSLVILTEQDLREAGVYLGELRE